MGKNVTKCHSKYTKSIFYIVDSVNEQNIPFLAYCSCLQSPATV